MRAALGFSKLFLFVSDLCGTGVRSSANWDHMTAAFSIWTQPETKNVLISPFTNAIVARIWLSFDAEKVTAG